jgi:hypothetical protein
MKILLALVFFVYVTTVYPQQTTSKFTFNTSATLIAENAKHVRRYANDEVLKIYYHDSGKIVKAKGSLYILDSNHVQLLPFRSKTTFTLNTSAIYSVGLWKRRGKIDAAILGGTEILTAGIALSTLNPNRPSTAGTDEGTWLLVFYSFAIVAWEIIDIPSIYLSEAVSRRSEKKGYHFYIEMEKGKPYRRHQNL